MIATHLAHSIVRQLIELGISDFVLSPGSRNAPISLALHEAEAKGLIELHIRIDERGAAFYALGIAKASGKYVAVICTSGTAAANYHPAALEAYHSRNNIIFITADRPARLRRTGANQTTLQAGILAPIQTIDTAEIIDCSALLQAGPVHLNIQFDEPLLSTTQEPDWLSGIHPATFEKIPSTSGNLVATSRSVIIIGHDRAGAPTEFLRSVVEKSGIPLIAEDPLSFPKAVPHAALFLADVDLRESLKADQVIVIGRTTLSRSINSYIAQCKNIIVIDPRAHEIDTKREATNILFSVPEISAPTLDKTWVAQWKAAGELARTAIELDWSEQLAARTIAKNLPAESALFIGSSRPVRDMEAFAEPRKGVHVFSNRGLAGIDGNISTGFGISTVYERTYSVLGDLTFLHDLSALVNTQQINHTIFIIDNNGGGIFSTLPQAGVQGFEKVFGTPHNLNIESIIKGFGYSVEKVKTVSDLERTFHREGLHFVLVEVPDREENARVLKELHQSVASAVRMGINLA